MRGDVGHDGVWTWTAVAGIIFEANRSLLTDPDKLYPGQTLILPEN